MFDRVLNTSLTLFFHILLCYDNAWIIEMVPQIIKLSEFGILSNNKLWKVSVYYFRDTFRTQSNI